MAEEKGDSDKESPGPTHDSAKAEKAEGDGSSGSMRLGEVVPDDFDPDHKTDKKEIWAYYTYVRAPC